MATTWTENSPITEKNIDSYIDAKLKRANSLPTDFGMLFTMMFSESEQVFWETNDGYRILKTTYGESRERILHRASVLYEKLTECGIGGGAVIGLYMENSLSWIEMFWSILLCGYRPLLLNLRMGDSMLQNALTTMQAAAVISDGKEFPGVTLMEREIGEGGERLPEIPCGEEVFLISSGTSGSIKICAYTPKEILAQISNAVSILKENKRMKQHYEGSIKQLTLLPFYHVFGLFAVYFWFGFFSRTFVHLPDMHPDTILNTVRKHQVTHIFAVPMFWDTVYRNALKTIRRRGEKTAAKFEKGMGISRRLGDMPVLSGAFTRAAFREVRENLFGESIQFCISGGSAIRTETLEFFNAIGYHLANGYGMTEIGIASVELSEKKRILNSGSIGHPMSSVSYTLSENGALEVCGASVAHAIVEAGVRREMEDRSIATNDLMRAEGERYFVLGRRDDVIISLTGENLNPDVVEQMFDLPDAQGFCLIPVCEKGQTIPVMVVSVSCYLAKSRLEGLSRKIQEQIEKNCLTGQIGRVVFVTDALMRPEEIKINRKRLARSYQEGALHFVDETLRDREDVRTMMQERVAQIFAETLDKDPSEIRTDSDFFLNEGGSSIDYYTLIGKLRDEFDVDLFGEAKENLTTVRDLCAQIEERLKE